MPSFPRDLSPWFHSDLALGESRIHGKGVLAVADISAGTMVFRLGGFLISAEERRSPLVIPSTAIGVTERLMLAEFRSSEKDLSDFVNHSCEPNCGFSDAITVVAARAIPGGDELTIDYGYWELDDAWEMVACKCGSVQCRGNVRGTDWLLDGVVERYQAWASPFIRRRITAKRNGGNT